MYSSMTPAGTRPRLDSSISLKLAQCVAMTKVAWTKHRLVQRSMVRGAFGIICLVVTSILLT